MGYFCHCAYFKRIKNGVVYIIVDRVGRCEIVGLPWLVGIGPWQSMSSVVRILKFIVWARFLLKIHNGENEQTMAQVKAQHSWFTLL